eukprot:scaffold10038_cov103-Alexandrium_tamarense.AAC.1
MAVDHCLQDSSQSVVHEIELVGSGSFGTIEECLAERRKKDNCIHHEGHAFASDWRAPSRLHTSHSIHPTEP